jgi:G:T/U-mismatch repair DNA glycosylase
MIDDAEREHLRRELAAIEAYRRSRPKLLASRQPRRCAMPVGYTRRPWGTFEKTVEFGPGQGGTVRLIRSASGRLLRVERSKKAQALRKPRP